MKDGEPAYPRFLEPGCAPFDPLELARQTEAIVCRGDQRKYTAFRCMRMYGGIATGYACGCCLRCVFCWVSRSRDFPEQYGEFCSPAEAFRRLVQAARKGGVDQVRMSGAEPTLGKEHLLGLLELVEDSRFRLFILETNGILLGAEQHYAREIARFKKVHTRIALKAGTPEAFVWKTGAIPASFELPFQAIANLLEAEASLHVAAMTADPRFTCAEERRSLLRRLAAIHPALLDSLEEEVVVAYPVTIERLRHAGVRLD
jgi:uncharacterized Fe-S cluster-containing radical SAM superfamily protein